MTISRIKLPAKTSLKEGKIKTYITEGRVRDIIEGAITALKPAAPEEGEK